MTTQKREAVNITGCLASNFGDNEDTPTLILNPKAAPLDMLAWCSGEVRSLQATVGALTQFDCTLSSVELTAIFGHRIGPLSSVLVAAMDAMKDQERAKPLGPKGQPSTSRSEEVSNG